MVENRGLVLAGPGRARGAYAPGLVPAPAGSQRDGGYPLGTSLREEAGREARLKSKRQGAGYGTVLDQAEALPDSKPSEKMAEQVDAIEPS